MKVPDAPQRIVVSDEVLQAYLAGRLTKDHSATVDAALLSDPDLADRLVALDPMVETLRQAGEQMLAAAPTARLQRQLDRVAPQQGRARWVGPVIWSGLAAAVFAAGVVVSPLVLPQTPPAPGWIAAASGMVRLFSPETFVGGAADPAADLLRLARQTGADLATLVPMGTDLTLVRAELLAFEGKPLIQLVYLSPDAELVAVCVLVRPAAAAQSADPSRRPVAVEGLTAVQWDSGNLGVLVLGRNAAVVDRVVGAL